MSSRSNSYIFQEDEQGELKFIGDFEGFYQSDDDPWQQSAQCSDISAYYHYSRQKIANYLKKNKFARVLEIGCGVGHSTQQLTILTKVNLCGADISPTAIIKAATNYPDLEFFQLDICQPITDNYLQEFDCIILNQLLWYIMHAMPQVKKNIHSLLAENGQLIFSTAFLNEQRYGNEYFTGYAGFIQYIEKNWLDNFTINYQEYDDSDNFNYHDGLLCLAVIDK